MNKIFISLILATLNRKIEIDNMLDSLSRQNYKNFEVIIVDQNNKGYLNEIIDKYKYKLNINYILIKEKGLSKARNIGLKYVKGNIIGFPDDDCKYQDVTLENVVKMFENPKIDAITGTITRDINKKCGSQITRVNVYNVWKKGISFTMFFRKKVVETVGAFDENLGVGSGTEYGSGEETDYLIRVIKKNFILCNTNSILVYHPEEKWNDENIHLKVYKYAKGRIYVLKKQNYSNLYILGSRCISIFKLVRYIYDKQKRKRFWYEFLGKIQ